MTNSVTIEPILGRSKTRIDMLDGLRGFAILGILIMNIQSFSMPDAAYFNPFVFAAQGSLDVGLFNSLEGWLYALSHLFAEQKFMTIFAILFGVSIMLISDSRPRQSSIYLLRRNFFLLVIGLLHAYLLWHGDILVTYALSAFCVIWLRHLSATKLALIGLTLVFVPVVITLTYVALMPYWSAQDFIELGAKWWPSPQEILQQIQSFQGSWLEQQSYRTLLAAELQQLFVLETGWRTSGLMLIGMAIYKLKIFTGALSASDCRNLILPVSAVGLILIFWGLLQHIEHSWQASYSLLAGSLYNYIGSLLVADAYICFFIFFYHQRAKYARRSFGKLSSSIMTGLESVGRTALSNYLLQSLICSLIFYGHGLGLFASLSRFEQFLLVPIIWFFQVCLSLVWLKYYSYGPMEWLWRSAVEWRCKPIQR